MSSLKDEMLIKSKPAWKLKDVNSIIESFEYFCQMSWKSIVIILSYAVSNLVHFCYKTQYSSEPARSVSGFLASIAVQKVYNNIIDVATTAKKIVLLPLISDRISQLYILATVVWPTS